MLINSLSLRALSRCSVLTIVTSKQKAQDKGRDYISHIDILESSSTKNTQSGDANTYLLLLYFRLEPHLNIPIQKLCIALGLYLSKVSGSSSSFGSSTSQGKLFELRH
ncbi:hypothetical protein Tco_0024694 [Tanacetum coccineum]